MIDYSNAFWINQGAPNVDFWAHEFSKHATCSSTSDKRCYANYTEGVDVVDFFEAAIRAFQYYPTYEILAANGILPSNGTRYSYYQLANALRAQTGANVYLGCSGNRSTVDNGRTILSEVW